MSSASARNLDTSRNTASADSASPSNSSLGNAMTPLAMPVVPCNSAHGPPSAPIAARSPRNSSAPPSRMPRCSRVAASRLCTRKKPRSSDVLPRSMRFLPSRSGASNRIDGENTKRSARTEAPRSSAPSNRGASIATSPFTSTRRALPKSASKSMRPDSVPSARDRSSAEIASPAKRRQSAICTLAICSTPRVNFVVVSDSAVHSSEDLLLPGLAMPSSSSSVRSFGDPCDFEAAILIASKRSMRWPLRSIVTSRASMPRSRLDAASAMSIDGCAALATVRVVRPLGRSVHCRALTSKPENKSPASARSSIVSSPEERIAGSSRLSAASTRASIAPSIIPWKRVMAPVGSSASSSGRRCARSTRSARNERLPSFVAASASAVNCSEEGRAPCSRAGALAARRMRTVVLPGSLSISAVMPCSDSISVSCLRSSNELSAIKKCSRSRRNSTGNPRSVSSRRVADGLCVCAVGSTSRSASMPLCANSASKLVLPFSSCSTEMRKPCASNDIEYSPANSRPKSMSKRALSSCSAGLAASKPGALPISTPSIAPPESQPKRTVSMRHGVPS